MILAGTGHRPNKLNNEYDGKGPISDNIRNIIQRCFVKYQVQYVISGMALGFDMLLAEEAIKSNLTLIPAIPFKGQESKWPKISQERYNKILSQTKYKKIISEGSFTAAKMQVRNEWMVDKCDMLLACWDGTPGGTGNCVAYAYATIGKERIIIQNPNIII